MQTIYQFAKANIKLRSTMSPQERLNGLATLKYHRYIDLDTEDVVTEFATKVRTVVILLQKKIPFFISSRFLVYLLSHSYVSLFL